MLSEFKGKGLPNEMAMDEKRGKEESVGVHTATLALERWREKDPVFTDNWKHEPQCQQRQRKIELGRGSSVSPTSCEVPCPFPKCVPLRSDLRAPFLHYFLKCTRNHWVLDEGARDRTESTSHQAPVLEDLLLW